MSFVKFVPNWEATVQTKILVNTKFGEFSAKQKRYHLADDVELTGSVGRPPFSGL